MNLTNYHSHCIYCDGRADMDSFIRFAIAEGFTSYGVSSHAPLPFSTHWSMEWDQMENYLNEFKAVKQRYADQIEFYVGLEIDYLDDDNNPSSEHFTTLPLDYRIGSVHLLENDKGEVIDIDVSTPVFAKIVGEHFNGDLERLIRTFYSRQHRMLELGGFDILGHADKLHKNALSLRPKILDEIWYDQLINELFDHVLAKGYMIEINTKAYETNNVFFPNERYFHKMNAMNIPVLVNSDAHYPERINSGRKEALIALKKAGFTTIRELHNNQWQNCKIEL